MKKRLRFQLPITPLKALRGQEDEDDVQDKYFERFKPPPTTTENEETMKVLTATLTEVVYQLMMILVKLVKRNWRGISVETVVLTVAKPVLL